MALAPRAEQRQGRHREEQHRQKAGCDKRCVDGGADKIELHTDLTRNDQDAERGCLQQPGGECLGACRQRSVDERRQAAGTNKAARKTGTRARFVGLANRALART